MPKTGSGRSRRRLSREGAWAFAIGAACCGGTAVPAAEGLRPYAVAGDMIPESLTGAPGDAARGRAIVADRQRGLCLLCHSGPFPEERFLGDLAPSLAGAGSRWSEGALRLRLVDGRRMNQETIMPSYHKVEQLTRVAPAWRDKPVLSAAEIEDVVAFLSTLREP